MKFFVDNNISIKVARALNCLVEPQHQVVHLREKFPPDTCVAKGLLHAVAGGVVVVFGFNDCDWHSRFPKQNVVSEFFLLLVSRGHIAPDDYRPRRKRDFATDLGQLVPARAFDRRRDVEIADVDFAKLLFFLFGHATKIQNFRDLSGDFCIEKPVQTMSNSLDAKRLQHYVNPYLRHLFRLPANRSCAVLSKRFRSSFGAKAMKSPTVAKG